MVASIFTFGATLPVAAGGYSAFSSQLIHVEHVRRQKNRLKRDIALGQVDEDEVQRLFAAANEFNQLARAVDAQEYSAKMKGTFS